MGKIEELENRNKPIPRPDKTSNSWSSGRLSPEEEFRKIYGPQDTLGRAEWLIERAEAKEEEANRLEGTCYMAPMSPSEALRQEASLFREQAALLLKKAKRT